MNSYPLSCLRRLLLWLCLGFAATAQATAINGVWSYSPGGYLVLMEVQGGTVVALRVDPAMVSGEAFVGTRSGDAVQAQSLSRSKTLALNVSQSSFSGTASSTGSSAQSISGNLLYAYAGSTYDGLWQRSGSDTRYQALVTFTADTVATTLLLDASVGASTTLSYDIALGTISTARTPTFRGASLLGSRTLSLAFGSTAPLSATFTSQSTGLPPQTLEQFVVNQVLPMAKASQTLTFGAAPSLSVGGTATVSASASSGLAVTFSSLSTSVCTVSGSTVTGLTAGSCTIAANQAGNATYEAAAQATQTWTLATGGRASQTLSFTPVSGLLIGGTTTLVATASSGLPVSFTSLSTSVCTVSGATVTALGAGTCSLAADQAGNASYESAPQVTQSVTLTRSSQSISFAAAPSLSVDATATLNATASSGLAVSYSSLSTSVCTVSGSTVSALAAGTCTVAADQTGNARYAAATQATQALTITAAADAPPQRASASARYPRRRWVARPWWPRPGWP